MVICRSRNAPVGESVRPHLGNKKGTKREEVDLATAAAAAATEKILLGDATFPTFACA